MGSPTCAAHAARPATATCATCRVGLCDGCHAFDVDGEPACAACGLKERATGEAIGGAQLAVTALAYLTFLALAIVWSKPKPLLGGLGAIFAIAFGRVVSMFLRPRVVVRRRAEKVVG